MMNQRNLYLLLFSNALASVGAGVAMIAVPWILAKQLGGGVLLSSLATILNVALFLLTPLIGPIVDLYSRKKLMISLRIVFCFGLIVIYIILKSNVESSDTISMVIYYCIGTAFYALNIPIRTAFVQELFDPAQYISVNSMLEVENQCAAVITGVIAIFTIETYGVESVVVLNAACYLIAIILLFLIPHEISNVKSNVDGGVVQSLLEGVHVAIQSPRYMAMLMASSIPYVVIITYTVLHPIAISNILGASSSTYALVEMLFAIGAIVGGIVVGNRLKQSKNISVLLKYSLLLFSATAIAQSLFPNYWGFICIAFLFGFWNSVVRILRQTLLMQGASVNDVGRITALLQSFIMLMRALSIFIVTLVITNSSINNAISFVALLSIIGSCTYIFVSNAKNKSSIVRKTTGTL